MLADLDPLLIAVFCTADDFLPKVEAECACRQCPACADRHHRQDQGAQVLRCARAHSSHRMPAITQSSSDLITGIPHL